MENKVTRCLTDCAVKCSFLVIISRLYQLSTNVEDFVRQKLSLRLKLCNKIKDILYPQRLYFLTWQQNKDI